MYERNAIILERYFDNMFGYNMKNNIKTNFTEYSELVKCLEDYRNISEEEEIMAGEYDSIANKIREIQKKQENLSKRNLKLQDERNNIFQNIDEDATNIQSKLKEINENIYTVNEEIKENANNFIEIVAEFSEKTTNRTACERTRRTVENEYNKKLNRILDDYREIDFKFENEAKQFIQADTEEIETQLKEKIEKNGEKEKIPFNMDVMTKAICLCVDIQKRETEILANIYEKTNRLFTEIKNNTIRLDKHKKIIKDSSSKLEFISAIKEYLFQFLDNERLTAVNGEEEHTKLMKEACMHLDEDLVQINNLYTLLLKEISKKITKKSYAELYKVDYLKELEKKSNEFDKEVKKLNLPVTVINPNYWRIEGMKRIYNVFYKCVTENYGRDLSEYVQEETEELDEMIEDNFDEKIDEEIVYKEPIPAAEDIKQEEKETKNKTAKKKKESIKEELDKKIDMILGFNNDILKQEKQAKKDSKEKDKLRNTNKWDEDDSDEDWDDEDDILKDEDWDDEEDEVYDDWDDDELPEIDDIIDDDDDSWDNDDEEDDNDNDEDNDDETYEEDEDNSSKKEVDNDWENEFIQIDKKDNKKDKNKNKEKKKKGFFDKFRK